MRQNKMNKMELSCPHIDRVKQIIYKHEKSFETEELFDLSESLEKIREINKNLRDKKKIKNNEISYNFNSILIKIIVKFCKTEEDLIFIRGLVKTYF